MALKDWKSKNNYIVIWLDRNYNTHKKLFKTGKTDDPEKGKRLAERYMKLIERKQKDNIRLIKMGNIK